MNAQKALLVMRAVNGVDQGFDPDYEVNKINAHAPLR